MKKKVEILKEVELEVERFRKKLALAIKEMPKDEYYGFHSKHYASVKRGAYDLKNELTKITQDSKYRYQQ